MKKLLKSTFTVVALTASCWGSWRAYATSGSLDNPLLTENIEALALNGAENSDNEDVKIRGRAIMRCWARNWMSKTQCDDAQHPKNCVVNHYAYNGDTKIIYECGGTVKRYMLKEQGLVEWKSSMGVCKYSTSAKTPINGTQPADIYVHSCQGEI